MRRIILISGAPGVGKSTIATPLANAFSFALLSKDLIKETLYDALDTPDNGLAYSRKIGSVAMELLWALTAQCPQVVIEANFRPHSEYECSKVAQLEGQLVEVHCHCSPKEARRRFAERAKTSSHHPAHVLSSLPTDLQAEYDRPIGLCPVVSVDTSNPVDIGWLVNEIETVWQKS